MKHAQKSEKAAGEDGRMEKSPRNNMRQEVKGRKLRQRKGYVNGDRRKYKKN